MREFLLFSQFASFIRKPGKVIITVAICLAFSVERWRLKPDIGFSAQAETKPRDLTMACR
jgi:hypothetical protein